MHKFHENQNSHATAPEIILTYKNIRKDLFVGDQVTGKQAGRRGIRGKIDLKLLLKT